MVAADSGLQTYVTRLATSSVIANRFKSEDGRKVLRWTAQHRIHRDCGAGTRFGKAARNGKLRGLRHAVVDHLGRSIDRALAADEHDAPPVPLLHAAQMD